MNYVLAAAAGVLAGFLLSKLAAARTYHRDVAQMLMRCLELEEVMAQELKKPSAIDYLVETKGMDSAILHYGSLFHILRGIPGKSDKLEQAQQAIGLFLQDAMKEDLARYREEREKKG